MTDEGSRYDRMAVGYEQWWAPVLRPSAHRLLDEMEAVLSQATEAIDIGAGTGTLTREALRRWPDLRVTAVDTSSEMLAGLAVTAATAGLQDRLITHQADAAALPVAAECYDVAMSSFVLQLVRDRGAALREIRRVLRRGGTLAYVTWMTDRRPFAPDRVFDTLLAEFGYEDEPDDARCGDVPSAGRAVAELRRAGFRDARATAGQLDYAFTVTSYIGFLTEFDEETLFDEMSRRERQRFLARLREGLMRLPDDDLVFRAGIVYASGIRSDR